MSKSLYNYMTLKQANGINFQAFKDSDMLAGRLMDFYTFTADFNMSRQMFQNNTSLNLIHSKSLSMLPILSQNLILYSKKIIHLLLVVVK